MQICRIYKATEIIWQITSWETFENSTRSTTLFCGLKSARYIFSAVFVSPFRPSMSNCIGLFDGRMELSKWLKYNENDSFQISRYNCLIIIFRKKCIFLCSPHGEFFIYVLKGIHRTLRTYYHYQFLQHIQPRWSLDIILCIWFIHVCERPNHKETC